MADHWFKIEGCSGSAKCEEAFKWFSGELCSNLDESACLKKSSNDKKIDELGNVSPFHEHELRRLKGTLKHGIPFELMLTKFDRKRCGDDADCDKAYVEIVKNLPPRTCFDAYPGDNLSADQYERYNECLTKAIRTFRDDLKKNFAVMAPTLDMATLFPNYYYWYRYADGFRGNWQQLTGPGNKYLSMPSTRIAELKKQAQANLAAAIAEPARPESPTVVSPEAPVAAKADPAAAAPAQVLPGQPPPDAKPPPVVKRNSLTVHLGAGPTFMPGGFNTTPIKCRDGTTICWTGTGPLPLNGVGNPTEIKPAGVIITGGFDYARLVWWRLHVGGGVDGMFAYLPTGSSGEPNNDPADIMAAGLGARVDAELRFDRWRVRVGGRVGFSYWTLIGGNGTFSLPYIPDVDGKQFSQWSPVAGILAGADFVIRRPIAVGLEGGCAWPLADWSQEVERFGRDYPNPDVTPDRPSPTVTCGIAVRGTYTIKSF